MAIAPHVTRQISDPRVNPRQLLLELPLKIVTKLLFYEIKPQLRHQYLEGIVSGSVEFERLQLIYMMHVQKIANHLQVS